MALTVAPVAGPTLGKVALLAGAALLGVVIYTQVQQKPSRIGSNCCCRSAGGAQLACPSASVPMCSDCPPLTGLCAQGAMCAYQQM